MPSFAEWDKPVSVLATRAIRAGLVWRYWRFSEAFSQHGKPSRDRNAHVYGRIFLERGVPPTGLRPDELGELFRRWWPVVRPYSDADRFCVESILSVLWQVRERDGDLVECGSYRCGLGFLLAFAVKAWGLRKKVHLYDSFEGLPSPTDEDRDEHGGMYFYRGQFHKGHLLENAMAFVAEHNLSDIVEFHQGWFDQTLPLIPSEQRFCFASIDCDLYESVQTCWRYLLPHMSIGAGVVVDDYDSPGVYKALWDYLESLPSPAATGYPLYIGALRQAHFFIGPTPLSIGQPDSRAALLGREDWAPLLTNRVNCAYLAGLCGEMIQVCSGPPQTPRDEQLYATLDALLGAEIKITFLERFIAFLYHQV